MRGSAWLLLWGGSTRGAEEAMILFRLRRGQPQMEAPRRRGRTLECIGASGAGWRETERREGQNTSARERFLTAESPAETTTPSILL